MPKTTPLIKAALNLTVGAGFDIYLTLPNVTNYEEFRSDLIKDAKFEKAVQSMTIDRIAGKSTSMSKFKYV